MPSFSQRKGIIPLEKSIQHEAMDQETRNQLWSILHVFIFDSYKQLGRWESPTTYHNEVISLMRQIWAWFLKRPSDEMRSCEFCIAEVRDLVLKGSWNTVLDILEFITRNWKTDQDDLIKAINGLFTRESCGYRFVGNEIAEITDSNEIEAIESAARFPSHPVATHMASALKMLTDRDNPDYRNSIKESISAIEALCREVTGSPKATLGDALKKLKGAVAVQPAFRLAMDKLYGYTSDDGGIRHSLIEDSSVISFDDAKYFLVVCSGFINYVRALGVE